MPFSLLYGLIVSLIHFAYDTGLMKASRFSIPVIGVGNLSIGGTGKTPHIEYIVDMLHDYIDVATLSRGYKRETSGFRLVNLEDTALSVGDEPLQFKTKYPDITVAVGESRAYAIPQIIMHKPDTQVVLLDDSFQHRGVAPGLNILLSSYDNMFTEDYLLPSGRLREWRAGYKRADIIIVTKCPFEMTTEDRDRLIRDIRPLSHQRVFFTFFEYGQPYNFYNTGQRIALSEEMDVLLLSAIANTQYLEKYVAMKAGNITEIEFTDHHIFDGRDIEKITKVFRASGSSGSIVLTTEKDAMRLQLQAEKLKENGLPVYILPVRVRFHFDGGPEFEKDIKDFLLNFQS
jgi:tetraacyldisaccharide 4'-kinase